MSKDLNRKYKINFLADGDLIDSLDKKLIDDKVKGKRRYKDRTEFYVKKMKDYIG